MKRWTTTATVAGFLLFFLWTWAPLAVGFAAFFQLPVSEALRLVVPSAPQALTLVETVAFAAGVAIFATAAGMMAALYCWKRTSALARWVEWTALLAAPAPAYLHALAWLPVFAAMPGRGAGGVLGWFTSGWVQALGVLPFCFGLICLALGDLDPRLMDAGRVYGDDRRLVRSVLWPCLRPAALAAFSLAFLLTISDPSVPSLFSQSTYAMQILVEFSATHDAAKSMLLSVPLLAAGLLALVPLSRYWNAVAQRPQRGGGAHGPLAPGVLEYWLKAGGVIAVLPALALTAALVRQLWPVAAWRDSLPAGLGSLGTSAAAGVLAAVLACGPAITLSNFIAGRHPIAWWYVSAPLAAPAGLAGAGLIWIWNRDLPVSLYGSFWMLVLAALARFTPLATLAVAAWRSRLDGTLLEAATLFSPPWRAYAWIEVPLLAPGVAAGAAVVFALALSEVGATLLVAPPGSGPLGLRIYNYLHYGASGPVWRRGGDSNPRYRF